MSLGPVREPVPALSERERTGEARRTEGRDPLLVLALVVLSLTALLPVARLVWAALERNGAPAFAAALGQITSRGGLLGLVHSLETSLASALVALAIGATSATAVTLTEIRGRRVFAFLFVLAMMMSPQVVALAFAEAFGPSSPLLAILGLTSSPASPNPLHTPAGIVGVLALHHAPLAFITLRAGLIQIPRELMDAAAVDGAGRLATLGRVILPLMRGHLAGAGLLCFLAALGNFGIPALLGVAINYQTLPTLIYRRLSSSGPGGLGDAAALSLPLILLTLPVMMAARRILPEREHSLEAGQSVEGLWQLERAAAAFIGAGLALLLALCLALPIGSLLSTALVPTYGVPLSVATVTVDNFVEVLWRQDVTARAIRNSLLYSGLASAFVALLALPVALALVRRVGRWRGPAEAVLDMPYALPGIVLAVAAILLFLRPLPLVDVSLYGTGAIIVLAYLSRFLPVAVKAVTAAVEQIDPTLEEAAALCGAGTWRRILLIVLPLVGPSAAAGALLVFLIAFNELTVSALLWSSGTETIGTVLFGLEEAGLSSQAAALALSTVAVVAALMLVLEHASSRLPPRLLPWS